MHLRPYSNTNITLLKIKAQNKTKLYCMHDINVFFNVLSITACRCCNWRLAGLAGQECTKGHMWPAGWNLPRSALGSFLWCGGFLLLVSTVPSFFLSGPSLTNLGLSLSLTTTKRQVFLYILTLCDFYWGSDQSENVSFLSNQSICLTMDRH